MTDTRETREHITAEDTRITLRAAAGEPCKRAAQLVRWRGELLVSTVARAETILAGAWERARGADRVILDLTDVDFIDSTGIGFLLRARREASARSVELVLVVPPHRENQAIRLMRSSGTVVIRDDLAAALLHP